MLRIRFFAAIREKLSHSLLEVPLPAGVEDVGALISHLDTGALPGCAAVLLADNTIVAVNRSLARASTRLSDGDEVAFYPPVTGG